jgi:hypothetical protein
MIELSLQILLGIVALICLSGGLNLLIKGVGYFLPKTTPPQPVLDNVFRFLSGMYFSMGFLITWVVFNPHETGEVMYPIGIVVTCSGLGRLYSRMKVGVAGGNMDRIMVLEVVLGISIIILQYSR